MHFDVSLFERKRERERERRRVCWLRNNFSSNWVNFNFCSETIELCCQLLESKVKLNTSYYMYNCMYELSSTQWLLKEAYILTYLIGHNNPINGCQSAGTHPSRRLWFLRAYASWLHQSMTGLPQFGLSNGCKVVLFADFRRSPHQISVSPEHAPPYERHGRARAATEY